MNGLQTRWTTKLGKEISSASAATSTPHNNNYFGREPVTIITDHTISLLSGVQYVYLGKNPGILCP